MPQRTSGATWDGWPASPTPGLVQTLYSPGRFLALPGTSPDCLIPGSRLGPRGSTRRLGQGGAEEVLT